MGYIRDFDHLQQIVKSTEQDDIEYKDEQYLNNLGANSKIAKFVSGFANSEKGGSIIFGVADDGSLIGIEQSKLDDYKRKIIDWIRTGISGSVFYETYDIQYPENPKLYFLIIDIPRSNLAPHLHNWDRIYYKREGPSIGRLSTHENGKFIPLSEREIYNLYRDRMELQDRLQKKEEFILNNLILKYNGIDSYFYFLIQPVYDVENFLVKRDDIKKLIFETNNNYIFQRAESVKKDYFGASINWDKDSQGKTGKTWLLNAGEILTVGDIKKDGAQPRYSLDMLRVYNTLGFTLKIYRNYYKKYIHLNPQISLKIGFVKPNQIWLPNSVTNTFIGDPEKTHITDGVNYDGYSDINSLGFNLFEKVSGWFGLDDYLSEYKSIEQEFEESKDL